MEVGCQCHVPAALPPRKTRYLLYTRPDGPQDRSGRVQKNLVFKGIRSLDPSFKEAKIYTVTFCVAMPCDMVVGVSSEHTVTILRVEISGPLRLDSCKKSGTP